MPISLDDEDSPLYSVGQVAGLLGVQAAFLRRLDLEQVVRPARSDGGQRRYTRAEVRRVERVSEMAGEGLTLAGIRRILALEAEVAALKRQLREAGEAAERQPRRRSSR
jgi:MerR family transcriptional regulator/heat shock protein HspR